MDDHAQRDQPAHEELRARAAHHRRRVPGDGRGGRGHVAVFGTARRALPRLEQCVQPRDVCQACEEDGVEGEPADRHYFVSCGFVFARSCGGVLMGMFQVRFR